MHKLQFYIHTYLALQGHNQDLNLAKQKYKTSHKNQSL